jgi:hypothetical protein
MDNHQYVTSPTLADNDIVGNPKELSDALTLELTDHEISRMMEIFGSTWKKYIGRTFDTVEQGMQIVTEAEKEITDRMANELEVLCTIDVSPMLMMQPPILEIHGKLPTSSFAEHGFDHEKKEYEVKEATVRGEDWLGQKEDPNRHTKAKKRGWRNKKGK